MIPPILLRKKSWTEWKADAALEQELVVETKATSRECGQSLVVVGTAESPESRANGRNLAMVDAVQIRVIWRSTIGITIIDAEDIVGNLPNDQNVAVSDVGIRYRFWTWQERWSFE